MAKKKINEFPNVTPVSTDLYLVELSDGSYGYVTGTQLLSFFGGGSQSLADTLTIGRKTGQFSIESDNGFSYLYAINVRAGHEFDDGTVNGKMISDVNQNEIKHTVLNKFDAPSNIFTSATANKIAVFNSIKELVSGTLNESQLATQAYVAGLGYITLADLTSSLITSKILTGLNITGGSINSTDSILQAFGKVQNQINGVLGGAIYQGIWNATTNTPSLTSGVGTKGYYYVTSVAGSTNIDGTTDWKVGDWIIFNGTTWDKVDNTDAVSSVNGQIGAVNVGTILGTVNANAGEIPYSTGTADEVESSDAFTWDNTNKILKTGSQASIGSYIGVQLLADNSCTIPFSISSLGRGDGYVNFSVSANPTSAPADSFLFHGDGETFLMGVWGTYLTTDDGTDINSLVLGPRLTTLNKSLLIRDIGSIGHVDEAHAKFHAFDEALGVYFKASTGTTNWNLGDSFGFDFGVNSTGDGEIRQRENKGIDFYTNNVKRWNTNNIGNTYFGGGTIATALVQIAPNTTTRASFNIGVGVTPVSGMVNGDINNYGGRLHHRVGGVTQDVAYLSDITGLSELEVRRTSSLMTT